VVLRELVVYLISVRSSRSMRHNGPHLRRSYQKL
jgi:hypothetical protein